MTDDAKPVKQKKDRPKRVITPEMREKMFKRVDLTVEEAFRYYVKAPMPRTWTAAHQLAKADGYKISYELFAKWGKKYRWEERLGEADPSFSLDPLTIVRDLVQEAKEMNPGLIKGLQARLALKIATEINQMKFHNTAELERAVKVVGDMDELLQRHRGLAIPPKLADGNGEKKPGVFSLNSMHRAIGRDSVK